MRKRRKEGERKLFKEERTERETEKEGRKSKAI